jgi:dihydroneopterin aldolase
VSDVIELRGLRASGICGALPEERDRPQPLEIDAEIEADLSIAGRSDDLDDTVDYGALAAGLERVVVAEQFMLLERLAQRLCEVVLDDPRVTGVTISVRKLRPPVPQQLDTSGVRITRRRP